MAVVSSLMQSSLDCVEVWVFKLTWGCVLIPEMTRIAKLLIVCGWTKFYYWILHLGIVYVRHALCGLFLLILLCSVLTAHNWQK